MQGHNARAVVSAEQIVIAADVTIASPDFGHLEPMIDAAQSELADVGINAVPEVVLADAGAWHHVRMDALVDRGMQLLISLDAGKRKGTRPGWDGGLDAFMRRVPATDRGGGRYAKRQAMIEPVYADHEVQPPLPPLPTPRQIRRPLGIAPDRRHPQPPEALAAHHGPDTRLRGGTHRRRRAHPRNAPQHTHHDNHHRDLLRNRLRESRERRGLFCSLVPRRADCPDDSRLLHRR